MSDADARRSTVQFGPDLLEISDPMLVQPVSAEVITELRFHNGVMAISFGTIVVDGAGQPEVRVCARLRLTNEVLSDVSAMIERHFQAVAAAKQQAN
jgi:hypothetical protein